MKSILIPDVHNKTHLVDTILARHTDANEVVFLGDFFDDYGDTPEEAFNTAVWIKGILNDPRNIVLLGNHDMSYWKGHNYRCSGWSLAKSTQIHNVLNGADWNKFRLHYWCQGFLCTHAGLDQHWLQSPLPHDIIPTVNAVCERALEALRNNQPDELLNPGWARGGTQPLGGVNWQDWQDLELPLHIKQICGHTHGKTVRIKSNEDGDIAWCIDTNLRNYAVITDGQLEIKET